jgi:hypothetical protein
MGKTRTGEPASQVGSSGNCDQEMQAEHILTSQPAYYAVFLPSKKDHFVRRQRPLETWTYQLNAGD